MPTNQLARCIINRANEISLTNSCVISNAVTTGPAGSHSHVRLAFYGTPEPKNLLSYRFGTGDTNYGNAYYDAIDPAGAKRTFAAWKAANGFNAGADAEAI